MEPKDLLGNGFHFYDRILQGVRGDLNSPWLELFITRALWKHGSFHGEEYNEILPCEYRGNKEPLRVLRKASIISMEVS